MSTREMTDHFGRKYEVPEELFQPRERSEEDQKRKRKPSEPPKKKKPA